MSLGAKTTAVLAAIVLAVLSLASAVSLAYQERALEHAIFDGVDGAAQVAARGIGGFVKETLVGAGAVASNLDLGLLARGRRGELEDYLARMHRTFPLFKNGIFVLDGTGILLADYPAHPELRGASFAFRDYFRRTVEEGRGVVGEAYRSKRTGRPVLTFTAPVQDEAGRIVAVVGCSVDLLDREALGGYRDQKYGLTGYLYIFDRTRLLVLHPEDERLLSRVDAGKNAVLEAALTGFEGAGTTVNSKGVPMLLAVRHVPGTDWTVGLQLAKAEAFEAIAAARARVALTSALALLLVVTIGAVAIRRVTGPLRQLEQCTARLGLEVESCGRVGPGAVRSLERIRSTDEIGHLAASFRRLAAKLDDRNRLERELRQAQKLEAVGRLAGGVAHEFNNMLTVVLSAGRYLREELPPTSELGEAAGEIVDTAARASELTRRLLDFSRRQAGELRPIDLREVLRAAEGSLPEVLGPSIQLSITAPKRPCPVRADPDQLDRALRCLASNAREAMPGGGRFAVSAQLVEAGGQAVLGGILPEANAVAITVSDTGAGMAPETAHRAFEPFFTTKPVGRGAGLGLSLVHGIVQQCGGAIRVTSAPGRGTTFHISLPVVAAPALGEPRQQA